MSKWKQFGIWKYIQENHNNVAMPVLMKENVQTQTSQKTMRNLLEKSFFQSYSVYFVIPHIIEF